MIEPTEDDYGRAVVYRARGKEPEVGVIVRVTEAYVFVRYGLDWTPKATRRESLEWAVL